MNIYGIIHKPGVWNSFWVYSIYHESTKNAPLHLKSCGVCSGSHTVPLRRKRAVVDTTVQRLWGRTAQSFTAVLYLENTLVWCMHLLQVWNKEPIHLHGCFPWWLTELPRGMLCLSGVISSFLVAIGLLSLYSLPCKVWNGGLTKLNKNLNALYV